jgi:hypothetical protein
VGVYGIGGNFSDACGQNVNTIGEDRYGPGTAGSGGTGSSGGGSKTAGSGGNAGVIVEYVNIATTNVITAGWT